MSNSFYNPTRGKLSLKEVAKEISAFIKEEPEKFYRLIIGSDSKQKQIAGRRQLELVSAIVVHREGRGGRYFWQKIKRPPVHSLRQKIYAETLLSLEVAQQLLPALNQQLNGRRRYELEIHIDVGQAGETRDMIKEVVGMVVGNGFQAKTKPESYAASNVADRHV